MYKLLLIALISSSAYAEITNESELSLVNTSGNSNVENYIAKTKLSIPFNTNAVNLGGHYSYATADKVINAREWDAYAGLDHKLSEKIALTFKETVEGNKFAGIKIRYNSDLGVKFNLFESDANKIDSGVAYRYTVEEDNTNNTEHFNKAFLNVGHSYEHSKTLKVASSLEYVPNFTTSEDWQLKATTSLFNSINSIFSLKVSYEWIKDNLPNNGSTPYDRKFTTGLIAKF